jgi:hypothetical protein
MKIPRWVIGMAGIFFGSVAALTITICVVLLRGPAPAATAGPPSLPVATTSASLAQPSPIALLDKAAPASVNPAASPLKPEVRSSLPVTATPKQDRSAPADRVGVSHPAKLVRQQTYRSRRSTLSSVSPERTEKASRQSAPDALDSLLAESSLQQ